jgi:hypothetical protein
MRLHHRKQNAASRPNPTLLGPIQHNTTQQQQQQQQQQYIVLNKQKIRKISKVISIFFFNFLACFSTNFAHFRAVYLQCKIQIWY